MRSQKVRSLDSSLWGVTGNESRIDGADVNSGDPIRLQPGLG